MVAEAVFKVIRISKLKRGVRLFNLTGVGNGIFFFLIIEKSTLTGFETLSGLVD